MKILWFFVLQSLILSANLTKLNFPRVLLPIFDKISMNFTITVDEGGCIKWSTSRQDLIQLQPIYDETKIECSHKVVVTSISKERSRNTAIVLAEDVTSGEILRCDVILDVIEQLGVLTTTRELYLEEAPETFELWAIDSQGNAFTTLEGVEFNWQISSENYQSIEHKASDDTSWRKVLKFLTFSESKYHDVPKTVERFEYLGLKGYMVLLEGINTGSARVTVKLPYAEYSHVAAIEVDIMVLANLLLDPLDVYILPEDQIHFRVLQLKKGKLHEIQLNSQYYLEIEDTKYANIIGNTATGLTVGRTFVALRDRNVPIDTNEHTLKASLPKSSLTVTQANRLTLNLLPYYNWVTVEGERHEIALDLYTKDDQKITLGTNYQIKSAYDNALFYAIETTNNGTRISGEAIRAGTSPVTGSFQKLKANAEMLIYKGIDIIPQLVILPYDPNNLNRQQIQFKATGGDSSYAWSSTNPNIVHIAQNGLAETRLDNVKSIMNEYNEPIYKLANVKVAMARNNKISKTAQIFFLPPVKLEIVSYNFETALHDYVRIHVALFAKHNNTLMPFTSCENLQFDVEFSQQLFRIVDQQQFEKDTDTKTDPQPLLNGACRVYYLKSIDIGNSELRINYNYAGKQLRDEVNLFVFEKLMILNPEANEIVLPIGASQNLFYLNGPTKLFTIESDLQKNVAFDKKIVEVTEIGNQFSKDKHVFTVLCRQVGTDTLKLEIYNLLSTAENKAVPYISEFTTKIYCVKPRFINLYTTQQLKASCPLERKNSMMQVKTMANELLEVDIEILDVNHRKLTNISSLLIEWDFSKLKESDGVDIKYSQKTSVDLLDNFEVPKRDYLKTSLRDIDANFKIHAVVTDYKKAVLKSYSIKAEIPQFGIQKISNGPFSTPVIENEINFISVNKTLLPFDRLSIYASTGSVKRIPIRQGSGFYEIQMNDYSIVAAEFNEQTKELLLTPKNIGDVRIEIIDRCLMGESSYLYISVVSQGRMEVQVPDRVEKGKSIEAIVKMYDSNDELLSLDEDLQFYELHEDIFNSNILKVQLGSQKNLDIGEIRYIVTGSELGDTKVIFHSGHNEKLISSSAASIQVFPPLTLFPRNATIIVGSSLQIHSKGGPSPDVNIVYYIQKEDVISIDSSVALALKLGHTKITGRCIGINPATGNQIVFSEDSIHIHVIPLSGIQIKTPLTRLKSGSVVPASIWAKPDISPLILGTLDGLKVQWSTDQPNVIEIKGIFDDVGIRYKERDSIAVRLRALSPGKANIYAVVTTGNNVKTTVSCEITVFKQLELDQPKRIVYDPILIPPKSSIQLKANLNAVAYELESETGNTIKVTKDGLVKSGDANGRTLVIASSFDQTLSIPVEVKNIHYIMANVHERTTKLKSVEDKIPQSLNIFLKITLHDNLGNEFSQSLEEINVLRYKSSRKEMLDLHFVGNFTVGLNLLRETTNMLSVYLKDNTGVKYSEDFIKISVGQSPNNFPKKTSFTVGDVICFESALSEPSNWHSSNDRIVKVNANTGVATVLSSNIPNDEKVTITHGVAAGSHVNFDLEVRAADKIEFFKTYDIFNGETYRGYLIIKNSLQTDKFTNMIAKNITQCSKLVDAMQVNLFACRLNVKQQNLNNNKLLDHFKTFAIFDRNTGTYGCEIELLTSLNSIVDSIKNADISLELQAQLTNGFVDTATLKIVPAVSVSPTSISIDEIEKTQLVVSGLDKVLQKLEVKPSNPSAIEISQYSKASGSLHYKIKLLNTYKVDDELFVKIYSPSTLQTIEVPILSPHLSRKCSIEPFYNMPNMLATYVSNFGLLISAIVVLVASMWVFVCCLPQKQKVITNSTGGYNSASPFLNDNPKKNVTSSPFPASPQTPSYQGSRYIGESPSRSGFNSTGSDPLSPVYGGDTPQKRINRRYL